jgi:hypothetical protein
MSDVMIDCLFVDDMTSLLFNLFQLFVYLQIEYDTLVYHNMVFISYSYVHIYK